MKRFFALKGMNYWIVGLVSVWFVGCAAVPSAVRQTAASMPSDQAVWNGDNRSDDEKNTYRVALKTPGNSISGLCMLKKSGDEWRGTFMNEMGAKAFDFIVTDKKCELLNVISMMNKSYVKKTVAADLYFFFNVDNPAAPFRKKLKRFEQDGCLVVNYGKKQILAGGTDGFIRLMNNRHNLQYEWRKMP
jgi:hypothetical protein